jgi:hypothetical protein
MFLATDKTHTTLDVFWIFSRQTVEKMELAGVCSKEKMRQFERAIRSFGHRKVSFA